MTNPIQTIKDLTQSALGDINSAATLADLEKVRVAEKSYLVTFLSSEARPWQRRSLQALKLFAKGIVSIETC